MPKTAYHNPEGFTVDYPYVRAWCRYMGSAHYYLEDEVNRARESHAPADAIYPVHANDGSGWDGKTWRTMGDVVSATARANVERIAQDNYGKQNLPPR